MADSNLTPIEILNDRYKKLVGRSYEELIAETNERFSKHKESLLSYLEQPDEIRAYLDANRFDSALAFAVSELDKLLHADKDEQGRYKTPHQNYCQLFKNYKRKFFVWDNIQEYLQSVKDTKAKFIYLVCLKGEIEIQKTRERNFDRDNNFSELCGFEISKLEAQLLSEQGEEKSKSKERRSGGGSQYQNLLAIHYLLVYCQAKDNKKAKARFASFLTGFSENTFYNALVNLHAKQDENYPQWEKDMKAVKNFFADLGLDEIVRMIENDLNF